MYSKPTLSVIVPIYGVEEVLPRCIDSILNQSFTDYEIILIDDGSKDSCPKICDEYAKKDSRIKVLHKINRGVSQSRNVGVKKAIGKYITFVDGDDCLIDKDTLKINIDTIKSEPELDFVQFPWVIFNDHDIWNVKNLNEHRVYSPQELFKAIFIEGSMHGFLWGKIFVTSKLKNMPFRENFIMGEDALFYLDYIDKFNYCMCHDKGLYGYYQRNQSGARLYNSETSYQLTILSLSVLIKASQYNIDNSYLNQIWLDCCENLINNISFKGINKNNKKIINSLKQYEPAHTDLSRCNPKRKKWITFIKLIGMEAFVYLYTFIIKLKKSIRF